VSRRPPNHPAILDRLERAAEGSKEGRADEETARKLGELELAVRRIEARLSGGSQGDEKPPAPPQGDEHGGHGGVTNTAPEWGLG
jgi:hypothetical protein